MARYVVSVRTARRPTEAFAYMADLTNFAEWDPGVKSSTQVSGDGAALDSAYDAEVKSVGGSMTLRYELIEFDSPTRFVARAESSLSLSVDEITVEPDGDGSVVTYDAELTLKGVFTIGEPALKLVFDNIGNKAADGLVSVLDGVRVGQ